MSLSVVSTSSSSQVVDRHDAFLAVEHAQHDVLAVHGGNGRDAEIDLAAGQGERDAPVLRCARLGDVHAAHDFQAHGERRPVVLVQGTNLAQHAVDAVAEAQKAFFGLEMDIRRTALDRIGQQRVDQAYDRLAVLGVVGIETFVVDLAGLDLAQNAVDGEFEAVELVDGFLDLRLAGHQRLDLDVAAEQCGDLIECDDVEGIRHREREAVGVGVVGQWQDAEAARHVLGDQPNRLGVHHDLLQLRLLLAERAAEHVEDDGLGREAQAHEDLAEVVAVLALLGQRNTDLVGADHALLHQQLADAQRTLGETHGAATSRAGGVSDASRALMRSSALAGSKRAGRASDSASASR